MHLIVYISDCLVPDAEIPICLAEITHHAKPFNQENGITGMLFYHKMKFIQILEGPRAAVLALVEKIVKDPRHKNIEVLVDETTDIRGFEEWNMEAFNLSAMAGIETSQRAKIQQSCLRHFLIGSLSATAFYQAIMAADERS